MPAGFHILRNSILQEGTIGQVGVYGHFGHFLRSEMTGDRNYQGPKWLSHFGPYDRNDRGPN